jgi:hypothetical protein
MAKMFYSLDEAAAKLGKSPDQVKEMADKGQLDQFRQREGLVYKKEQVDLLATGDDDGGMIPLADSGGRDAINLSDSDSARPGESTKEKSGISIFEADDLDDSVDASAQTQITGSVGGVKMNDNAGSGSGLLDLTRDSKDDTGIGPGILNDVYKGADDKEGTGQDMVGAATSASDRNALFESAGVQSDASMAAAGGGMVPMAMAFPIDKFTGPAAGLAVGMIITVAVALAVVLLAMTGTTGGLVAMVGENLLPIAGGLAGLTLICAVLGFVLGPKK